MPPPFRQNPPLDSAPSEAHLLRDWYNAMCDDELEAEREEEAERGQLNETLLTNELTALAKKLKLSEMARIDAEDEARQYRTRAEDLEQELEESRRELAAMTAEAQEETRKVKSQHQRRILSLKMIGPILMRRAYGLHRWCIAVWWQNTQATTL